MKELLPIEDKDKAFEYIIMGLLISSLDRDIEAVRNSNLKLKGSHIQIMENARNRAIKDAADLKKELFKKGIKVLEMIPVNEDFVSYRYMIRGYESEFRCFRAALKVQTEKKMNYYYSSF